MKEANEGLRRHKLLTIDIRKQLPKLNETDEISLAEKKIVCKFFSPYSGWRWYAVEFDGEDTFFGVVVGHETEWGYFNLNELAEVTVFGGVPAIERDCSFTPCEVGDIPELAELYATM